MSQNLSSAAVVIGALRVNIKKMAKQMVHLIHKNAAFHTYDVVKKRKEEGKDQESIQSNTTPDPGHHMGKRQ